MVCVQHSMGAMGSAEPANKLKRSRKLEKFILEINYAICLIYMLYFLIFPEKEYSATLYDCLILGYLYASTAILIFKDLKKLI